jgi:hypothetical protein
MTLLFDRKYEQIKDLLRPGRRQRDEARGLIRTLLAMEAHVVDEVEVNEADVNRVERAAKGAQEWTVAFPRLAQVVTQFEGDGPAVVVRISKTEGAPIRFIAADDPTEAAAVREFDLQKRFRYSPTELAKHLNFTVNKTAALKAYFGTDQDPQCMHEFVLAVNGTRDIRTLPLRDSAGASQVLMSKRFSNANQRIGNKPSPVCSNHNVGTAFAKGRRGAVDLRLVCELEVDNRTLKVPQGNSRVIS